MHEESEQDRVKPCLACDQLIPFIAEECPFCRSVQTDPQTRTCPQCASSIDRASIFCPHCGILTTSTAAVPPFSSPKNSNLIGQEKIFELGFVIVEASAFLCLAWLVMDHVF